MRMCTTEPPMSRYSAALRPWGAKMRSHWQKPQAFPKPKKAAAGYRGHRTSATSVGNAATSAAPEQTAVTVDSA